MIPSRLSAPTGPVDGVRSCIVEGVWVETPVDTEGDGMADLIAVYIRRPLACDDGLVVPAIYVADPSMLRSDDDRYAPPPTHTDLRGSSSPVTAQAATPAHAAPRPHTHTTTSTHLTHPRPSDLPKLPSHTTPPT